MYHTIIKLSYPIIVFQLLLHIYILKQVQVNHISGAQRYDFCNWKLSCNDDDRHVTECLSSLPKISLIYYLVSSSHILIGKLLISYLCFSTFQNIIQSGKGFSCFLLKNIHVKDVIFCA